MNLSWVNAFQLIWILVSMDERALHVSFQALILIEISPRQERLKPSVTCQVRDGWSWFSTVSVNLNIDVCRRKRFVCQLPRSCILMGISPRQERLKNSVACQVRDVELELSQRCLVDLNNDVSRWKGDARQLPSFNSDQDYQPGSNKVSPVRFEMSNLHPVKAAHWILVLMYVDENASPVSFKLLSPSRNHLSKSGSALSGSRSGNWVELNQRGPVNLNNWCG